MFLSTVSVFELLAAIQVGQQAISFLQNIPIISSFFNNNGKIKPAHSRFYLAFITKLKEVYNISNDSELPDFVRPVGTAKDQDVTIKSWFKPELLDENLMLQKQSKFGHKILLIESNVINRKILKTYELINEQNDFAHLLLGYLYYFINCELVFMSGHEKEMEHINKVVTLLDSMLHDPKIVDEALYSSYWGECVVGKEARLHGNIKNIIDTIKNTVKPKIAKHISRKTIKEKLDGTAQTFQLVSYALLNSLVLITEGNVNFQLSLDPSLIREGFLQTGSLYSWFSKDQAHCITNDNPLKKLISKGYDAIHSISQDKRSYGKFDLMLPGLYNIKQYLRDFHDKIDKAFLYCSYMKKGADTNGVKYILDDDYFLHSRAKFIYKIAALAVKLINTSYVIENLLDLIVTNNECWVFNAQETNALNSYFANIEREMQKHITDLNIFISDYSFAKLNKGIKKASSVDIIRNLNVAVECLKAKETPVEAIRSLADAEHISKYQLAHIKKETLYILDEHLYKENPKEYKPLAAIQYYQDELSDILCSSLYYVINGNNPKLIDKYFQVARINILEKEYGNEDPFLEFNSFFKQTAQKLRDQSRTMGTKKEDSIYVTGLKEKKHDNFYIDLIIHLGDLLKEKIQEDRRLKGSPTPRNLTLHANYLKHIKQRLLGLVKSREYLGDYSTFFDDDDKDHPVEEVHYEDYLALKETKLDNRMKLLEDALNDSSQENAKLNQIIKEHLVKLKEVNETNESLKVEIDKAYGELEVSKKEVLEHEQTQEILEKHIDQLLNNHIQNIEDCHTEVLTLDTLTDALKKIMSNQIAKEESEILLSIYDVITKFKEIMKVKRETLAKNAEDIVNSFDTLKQKHKLITTLLKDRTDKVLKGYKCISTKITEVIKKLEMQARLLNSITESLEKSKKEKAEQLEKARVEAEQRKTEKVKRRAEARERYLSEQKNKQAIKYDPEKNIKEIVDTENSRNTIPSTLVMTSPGAVEIIEGQGSKEHRNIPSKDEIRQNDKTQFQVRSIFSSTLSNFAINAASYWLFYFRDIYQKSKCAKLFSSILNNESLLFEHRLIVLNSIISKICSSSRLQYLNSGEMYNIIINIKKSAKDLVSNDCKAKAYNNLKMEDSVCKYTEDLENEVNSSFLYDVCFGRRKFM